MAQVSWTKQLILALALVVFGGMAYWLEYKHKPKQEEADEAAKKIFALKDRQVQSVLLFNGTATYRWECQDLQAQTCKPGNNAKWKMTEPMQSRADDANVNSLVTAVSSLSSTDSIDLKDESAEKRAALLKEYGLDNLSAPTVKRVDVTTPEGETVAYFGAASPINDNIFAVVENVGAGKKAAGKADESKVYLLPSYFKPNFDHELTYWRDKKLMTLAASEISGFELKSKKNGTVSGEKNDGRWTLKAGGEFDGDSENVDVVLNAASYLTAKDFVTDNKNDERAKETLKGASNVLTVTFQKAKSKDTPESAPITLEFFSKDTGQKKPAPAPQRGKIPPPATGTALYATISNADALYELQPNALAPLDKSLKDLRVSKLITSSERFSAKRLEFSGAEIGDKPLVLVSKGPKWLNDSNQAEVPSAKVQTLLDKISGNRIRDFLNGSAVPAGENQGLKLTLGSGSEPGGAGSPVPKASAERQFVFWKKDGKLLARDLASSRHEALLLDPSVGDGLPWSPSYFTTPPAPPKNSALPKGLPPGRPVKK